MSWKRAASEFVSRKICTRPSDEAIASSEPDRNATFSFVQNEVLGFSAATSLPAGNSQTATEALGFWFAAARYRPSALNETPDTPKSNERLSGGSSVIDAGAACSTSHSTMRPSKRY